MKFKLLLKIILVISFSFLLHSVYDSFPSFVTSFLLPVNESIWEHNKLILTSFLVSGLILAIIFRKDEKNYLFVSLIESIICILLVDFIFTPIYLYILDTKENFPLTIGIYVVFIIVSCLLGYKLLQNPYNKKREIISLIVFLILAGILAYFTYNPLHYSIFFDFANKLYGFK